MVRVAGIVLAVLVVAIAIDIPSACASCAQRERCYANCTEAHGRCLVNNTPTYCWRVSEECNRACERLWRCP